MTSKQKKSPAVPATPTPPLTKREAAQLARVTERTVDRWAAEGRFHSWRPIAAGSGRKLIDRATFLAFIGLAAEPAAAG
jgi:excisionase family DNA binding protein